MIVQGNFVRHVCLPVETKDVDEAKLTRRRLRAKLIMIFWIFQKINCNVASILSHELWTISGAKTFFSGGLKAS